MTSLHGIGIKNFRIFEKETYFDFSRINVLTGPNNSGKSSLIKFLLLLKDNSDLLESLILKRDNSKRQISFEGEDYKLNNFDSIITNKRKPLTFKIPGFNNVYYRFVLNSPGRIEHIINLCDKDDMEILSLKENTLKINLKLFINYFASRVMISSSGDEFDCFDNEGIATKTNDPEILSAYYTLRNKEGDPEIKLICRKLKQVKKLVEEIKTLNPENKINLLVGDESNRLLSDF